MLTPHEAAVRLALLISDSGKARGRISGKTIKFLSQRRKLTVHFVVALQAAAQDLGVGLIELDTGGFGVILASALEGAPTLLPSAEFLKMLQDPERLEHQREWLYDTVLTGFSITDGELFDD